MKILNQFKLALNSTNNFFRPTSLKPLSLAIVFLSLFFSACSQAITPIQPDISSSNSWQEVSPGIKTIALHTQSKNLNLVSINPQIQTLMIFENSKDQKLSLNEIRQKEQADFSFNGNFFTKDFQPTGLLISSGKELYPLMKAALLEGIFIIDQNNQAQLLNYTDFKAQQEILKPTLEFAIQNGPILLDNQGEVALNSSSNNKKSSRTAIGLDKNNNIIVILLKQTLLDSENSLSLDDFAKLLKESPELKNLHLHSVLNLDGGTSTGLSTNQQYLPELEKVENAIFTKKLSHD